MNINIIADDNHIPERKHPTDAGADLKAAENIVILPGHNELVATGVQISIPLGFAGFIHSRSGLAAKHQICVLNSPGTIDSGYRGELLVNLHNAGHEPFEVEQGDRIAQLIVQRIELCNFVQVETLDNTARGNGGHGSTGK